jgi:hypothetical protein
MNVTNAEGLSRKPNPAVMARRNDEAIADTRGDCFVPRNDGAGSRNDESGLARQPGSNRNKSTNKYDNEI